MPLQTAILRLHVLTRTLVLGDAFDVIPVSGLLPNYHVSDRAKVRDSQDSSQDLEVLVMYCLFCSAKELSTLFLNYF